MNSNQCNGLQPCPKLLQLPYLSICDLKVKKKNEEKNNKSGDEVLTTKTMSQLAWEAKMEIPSVQVKNVPYPLVPSKNDKERYFARFLDIFNELEITIPFRETLQ